MAETVQKIRVFISSPGDVQEERERLTKVFDELNTTVAAEKGLVLEAVRWETHSRAEIGDGPQEVIDRQLGHEFDVFLGIMWQRFGTPTAEADSGTEAEFLHAYQAWQDDSRRKILFYFCERPPETWPPDDLEQLAKVKRFRSELETKGLLGTYTTVEDFTDRVRRDLTHVVSEWADREEDETDQANVTIPPTRFTVFLADVDDSLKLLQYSLAKKLEKAGVGVLRANGQAEKPWEAEALSQAHASIHLLGEARHAGAERQLDLAMDSGQHPVLWAPRDLDLEGDPASADAYTRRLAALERREGVEREYDFIRERPLGACKVILDRVAKLREAWRQSSARKILFNVHENDAEFAWELVAHLEEQMALHADVYGIEDAPGMEAFEDKLARCNALVFVFGRAEPEWISNLMRHAMQKVLASGYSMGSWGVTLAPPAAKEMDPKQFDLPFPLPIQWIDLQHVDDEEGFEAEADRLRDSFEKIVEASG